MADKRSKYDPFQYIRDYYNVPAYKGMEVSAYGKDGVIVGADGCYISVRLAGDKIAKPYHPTDGIIYKVPGAGEVCEKGKVQP